MLISTTGVALGHIIFGVYSYLNVLGYDVRGFSWLSTFSFSFTIFISSLGLLGLPYLIIAEIMPPKLRSIGSMICMIQLWITTLIVLKVHFANKLSYAYIHTPSYLQYLYIFSVYR